MEIAMPMSFAFLLIHYFLKLASEAFSKWTVIVVGHQQKVISSLGEHLAYCLSSGILLHAVSVATCDSSVCL